MASADLQIAIRAADSASAVLRSVGASAQQMGNSAKSAGPSFLSMSSAVAVGTTAAHAFMGVAKGLAGIFTSAASSSADFGQSMADIRSLVPTADFDKFGGQVEQLAMRLGKDYPLSAAEAGKAMTLMTQKGISLDQILNGGAESVVKLSSATGADLVTASGIAANALDTFNVKAEDMGSVTNLMVGAMTRGGVSATDYGFAMAASGAVIKLAGGDVEDFSIAVAAMAKAGIEGSDAGTSLKSMYMNLQPTTKAAIATARELGIITKDGSNQFFDAAGNVKSYEEISGILANSLEGLTKQQQLAKLETIFGSDAIRAAAVAAKLGAGEYGNLGEQIRSVDAGEVAAKRMDSLKGALEQFKGSAETAGLMLMNGLAPALKQMIDWATEGINTVMPSLEQFGTQIGTAFTEGVTTAKDIFRQLVDAWNTVKEAFSGNWAPDASIEPLALAAGNAALKLKDLSEWAGKVANAAGQMGAWDKFSSSLETLGTEGQLALDRIEGIGESLGRLNVISGNAGSSVGTYAGALNAIGIAAELSSLAIGAFIDFNLMVIQVGVDVAAGLFAIGRGFYALATGDIPTFLKAGDLAEEAFRSAGRTMDIWSNSNVERVKQGYRAVAGAAETEMPAMANAVDSGTTAALGAIDAFEIGAVATTNDLMVQMGTTVDQGMTGVATGVENGMTTAVGAVEAAGPQFGTAATAAGTAAAEGIASAAPAMAAAAEAGATGAVTAVEGQTGAANAAGASVGTNIGTGMVAGIQSMWGSVWEAAKGMVSRALAGAQAEAAIESPSKKTMYMGQMLDEGLVKGIESGGPAVKAAFAEILAGVTDYAPVAREIARVEGEIKAIRDKGQTDALFRAKDLVTVESEALRLKQATVRLERDLVPLRQDLARATREVADIERGSLGDRTAMIEMDGKRKAIRLQTLDLEKQLVGLDRDSKRAKGIQEQIDKLRDQDQLLGIEAERIRLTNEIAGTGARIKKEALDDQVRGQEAVITAISDQIAILDAEKSVFQANEAIIKNATDNEIAYREQLIAVFKSEGKPLLDRITVGMALLEQLHNEGKISDELYNSIKKQVDQTKLATSATIDLGKSADTAAPQIDAATKKAEEMAKQAKELAKNTESASGEVNDLAKSLGKLPSWFTPKGGSSNLLGFGGGKADGGPVSAGMTYLVGERGPELFAPGQSGTIYPNVAAAGGGGAAPEVRVFIGTRELTDLWVETYNRAQRSGRIN